MNHTHSMLKMHHLNQNAIQNLFVNPILVKINDPNLLTNALQRSLHTKLLQISTHKTMTPPCQYLQINILSHTHIARFNLEDLKTSLLVGDTHIELAIKPSRTTKRRLNDAGAVRRRHNNHPRRGLEPVHQRQKLTHDALLHLPAGLVATGGDGIDLVNEDDRPVVIRRVGLGVLERPTQVRLRLPGAFGNDLGTVDDEEVRPGLGGHGAGHGGLAASRRAGEEDPAGGVDAELRPELGMAERQLDELADGREVVGRAADGVVSGVGEVVGVVAIDGLALAFDEGVVHDDAGGISVDLDAVDFDALELDETLRPVDVEGIAAVERTELTLEVRFEVRFEKLVGLLRRGHVHAGLLDGISVGEDQHRLAKLHVRSRTDRHAVPAAYPGIFHGVLRHANGAVVGSVLLVHFRHSRIQRRNIRVGNHGHGGHGLTPALPLDTDGVPIEDAQVFHGAFRHAHNGVSVIVGIVEEDGEGVFAGINLKDCLGVVLFFFGGSWRFCRLLFLFRSRRSRG
mmetsp:Transcript_40087/g.68395  ORF Transcript_40087/g.68395 Transcript_40087/m.68395 type:complete len:512 (-) Transcript_40087:377-1912(-)